MRNFKIIKTSATSFIIELDINTLSKNDQIMFFGKEYCKISTMEKVKYVQKHDYEFKLDLLVHLDLDIRYKNLKKGEYPVLIIKDKVHVLLTLS